MYVPYAAVGTVRPIPRGPEPVCTSTYKAKKSGRVLVRVYTERQRQREEASVHDAQPGIVASRRYLAAGTEYPVTTTGDAKRR